MTKAEYIKVRRTELAKMLRIFRKPCHKQNTLARIAQFEAWASKQK